MARDKPKKRSLEGESEGLSHNPFGALRGSVQPEREAPPQPDGAPDSGPSKSQGEEHPVRLVVRKERTGRGGKTITRVTGWNASEHDLDARARDLKRALGCGASVEGDDVCVQGDQIERVASHLERSPGARVVRGN